jgi:uncharacterized membrane protein
MAHTQPNTNELQWEQYQAKLSLRKVQAVPKPDFLTWIEHIKPGTMDQLMHDASIPTTNQSNLK